MDRRRRSTGRDDRSPDPESRLVLASASGLVRCGLLRHHAFDLTPERVRWAAGDDVEPPAEFEWRAAERGDPGALAAQLEATVAAVLDLGAAVVSSSREFNQHFDTTVFVALMRHIAAVLRQPRGHTGITTDP